MKLGTIILCTFFLTMLVLSNDLYAQCPMCRMTAESNLADGGTAGKGLNVGILFMLSIPYLLVGSLGYVWWRHNRKAS